MKRRSWIRRYQNACRLQRRCPRYRMRMPKPRYSEMRVKRTQPRYVANTFALRYMYGKDYAQNNIVNKGNRL